MSAKLTPVGGDRIGPLVEKIGVERGICVVLGDSSCRLGIDLARGTGFLVYTQLPDASDVEKARRAAEAAGLDATRFQVDRGPLSRLHLADNLADGLVAVGEAERIGDGEALRVLRPRARALLGRRVLVKPVPDGVDDWSHPYHGPDNNPRSRDQRRQPPALSWPTPPM